MSQGAAPEVAFVALAPGVGSEVCLTIYYRHQLESPLRPLPDGAPPPPDLPMAAGRWWQLLATADGVVTPEQMPAGSQMLAYSAGSAELTAAGIGQALLLTFQPRYANRDVQVVQLICNLPALPATGWASATEWLHQQLERLAGEQAEVDNRIGHTLVYRADVQTASSVLTSLKRLLPSRDPQPVPDGLPELVASTLRRLPLEAARDNPDEQRSFVWQAADAQGWLAVVKYPGQQAGQLTYMVIGDATKTRPDDDPDSLARTIYAERRGQLVNLDPYVHKTYHHSLLRDDLLAATKGDVQFKAAIDALLQTMANHGSQHELDQVVGRLNRHLSDYITLTWKLARAANTIHQQLTGLEQLLDDKPLLPVFALHRSRIRRNLEEVEATSRKESLTLETARTALAEYEARQSREAARHSKQRDHLLFYLTLLGFFLALTSLFDKDFGGYVLEKFGVDAVKHADFDPFFWRKFWVRSLLAVGIVWLIFRRLYSQRLRQK